MEVTRNMELVTRNAQPGTRNPQRVIRNQEPETRNAQPGTRNQSPLERSGNPAESGATRNAEPGTRNPKPETRNHEPATRNSIPVTLTYTGSSMNPTLKSGDVLWVVPYAGRKICVGDVVLIHPFENRGHVVHRVVSVDSQGLRTRGDNNSDTDHWTLCPDDIVGRVGRINRKKRTKKIYGGLPGRIYVSGVRAIKQIDSITSEILHPAYRCLATTGIFRKLLPRQMKPKVLRFKGSNFTEMQVLLGSRVVGRLLPGQDQWRIRRPFRLFIDESTLPKADDIQADKT